MCVCIYIFRERKLDRERETQIVGKRYTINITKYCRFVDMKIDRQIT
jgi:hypothetical protein